jgi:predicted transcriptional regulator
MELLKSAETPNLPTRMMYATNMSWRPIKIIIQDLIKNGLLKTLTWEEYYARPDTPKREERGYKPINPSSDHRTRIWYVVTEKGKRVLEYQEKILSLTDPGSGAEG